MVSDERGELPEERMIRNGPGPGLFSYLLWLALGAAVLSLLWGGSFWFLQKREMSLGGSPFLQVTNREMSLFLWQFPEYMRANVSSKTGYLPGFQYLDKVSIEEGQEEAFVSAPPPVLFLFHTWNRLIRNEFPKRPISARELREFLEYAPEWSPKIWKGAPKEYQELVATLGDKGAETLNLAQIPPDVQRALIGWKNYFLEGEMIKNLKPTYTEMTEFLERFPHYARNYWRNIVESGRPEYLRSFIDPTKEMKGEIPDAELAAFLKVEFFNYMQAKKNL